MTTEIAHNDSVGVSIEVGSVVATPINNRLRIGRVLKLNPKMVRVLLIDPPSKKQYWQQSPEYNKYPADCIVIPEAQATWYLLKM